MNATPSIMIFWLKFSASSNMALVHLFCFTTFFKFTVSKKFFCEKDFFWIFIVIIFLFVKQKILLKTPYMQKVRDTTFLRPKFDVRLLCKWKNSGDFVQFLPKKDIKCLMDHFLTAHPKFFTHFFDFFF